MKMTYNTTGTCSRQMIIELEAGIVKSVEIVGGCNGNTQGISRLVVGMPAEQVIKALGGIRCGEKPTSCPDQLATALRQMLRDAAIPAKP